MTRFAFLVLAVLPVCIASFLPVSNFLQGNKKRTAYKVVRPYDSQGECSDFISGESSWDNGVTFKVKVDNNEGKDIDEWVAWIKLNKEVTSLTSYNGQATQDSSDKQLYRITNASWNNKIAKGNSVEFNVQVTFGIGETTPKVNQLKFQVGGGSEKVVNCVAGDAVEQVDDQQQTDQEKPAHSPVVVEDVSGDNQDKSTTTEKPSKPEKPKKPETPANAGSGKRGVHVPWPEKVMGIYILLADDDEDGFENNADGWTPELHPWQQEAANVLFFTFIHPETMDIPPSFKKLAATRGTNQPGAVPKDTVIMFAIGGYAYSLKPNPWWWLETREAAEKMAEKVAEWPKMYNCDGIDLDLEEGAGSNKIAGPNMVHFVRKLRQLVPDIIIAQPTYGYPAVQAEIDVINASWDDKGNYKNVADSIGLMVYEGTQSLNYVKNYAQGSEQWEGFPVKVNAPKSAILLGAKGASTSSAIMTMAQACIEDDIRGIMVWYASVKNGLHYAITWDASVAGDDTIDGYKKAMKLFNQHMKKN